MYRDHDIRYNPASLVIAKNGMIASFGSDWEKPSAAIPAELEKE